MRAGRACAVAVACLAGAVLAACSGPESGAPRAGSRPSVSESLAPTPSAVPSSGGPASADPSAATATASAAPPGAPRTSAGAPVLVDRPGALPPEQRLRAPEVPFDQPASFPDGVSLAVREITSGVTSDTGVGASAQVPTTTVVVEVHNGSPSALDLSGVVATATSGPDSTPADPVYGGDQQDLSGVVASGGRAEGTYSFAIPQEGRSAVTLTLDLDGRHLPVVWRGAVP